MSDEEESSPNKLDLHGLTGPEALERLREVLERAHAERIETLEVVHGRGWRSAGKAVLPKLVRSYLQDLLQHPRSGIRRVRFGETVRDDPNPGVVHVDLFGERADAVFDPEAPNRKPRTETRPESRRPELPHNGDFDVPEDFEKDFDRYFGDEDTRPPS